MQVWRELRRYVVRRKQGGLLNGEEESKVGRYQGESKGE